MVGRALKAVLAILLLWMVWHQGGFSAGRLFGLLGNPLASAVAILLMLVAFSVGLLRWRMLLLAKGISIRFADVFRISLIGEFFGTVLPGGSLGGEVAKIYYVTGTRADLRVLDATSSVAIDRLLGLCGLVGVAVFAVLLNIEAVVSSPILNLAAVALLLLSSLGAAVWLLTTRITLPRRIVGRVEAVRPFGAMAVGLLRSVRAYRDVPRQLLAGVLLSLLAHAAVASALLLVARSIGGFERVSASQFFLVIPLGLFVSSMPLTPAGLGTGHAAFYLLFREFGSDAGADLFNIFLILQLSFAIAGGIVFSRRGGGPESPPANSAREEAR